MQKNFKLIINGGSGHDDKDAAIVKIEAALKAASMGIETTRISKDDDFSKKCKETVLTAKKDGSIVIAAGGDGTINLVAGFCQELSVPMGIIPMGTFNFFARDIGIPTDLDEAINLLITGQHHPTAIGKVGDQIFLVHVGIGLYADIIRNREKDKSRFGRFRIVALASSFWSLLTTTKTYNVTIETGTERLQRNTLNVFVGNNALQLEKAGISASKDLPADRLSVIILKPLSVPKRIRLAILGLFRSMKLEPQIEHFIAKSFSIETKKKNLKAAIDGELVSLISPLDFICLPQGLQIIKPEKVAS